MAAAFGPNRRVFLSSVSLDSNTLDADAAKC